MVRWNRGQAAVLVVLSALGAWALVAASPAAAQVDQLEQCVEEKVAAGTPRPQAIRECRAEAGEDTTPDGGDEGEDAPTTTASAPVVSPGEDAADDDGGGDDGGTSVGALAAAAVVGLLVGLVAGYLLARRSGGGPAEPGPAPVAAPVRDEAPDPALAAAADHRRLLVQELVELRDRVGSDALREQIADRLLQVGVREVVVAQGVAFDPQGHRGVDTVDVEDPAWDGRVARTERPGYADGDRWLRLPEVIVYRKQR